MEYEEFKQLILDEIKEYLPEEYANCEMKIVTKQKENQVELDGLTYSGVGNELVRPVYYRNDLYNLYNKLNDNGQGMTDILKMMADRIVDTEKQIEGYSIDIKDFEKIKDHIFASVVNAEINADLLQNIPHEIREDLAIVYRVDWQIPQNGRGSFLIHNSHLQAWGVGEEALKENAWKNMRHINEPILVPLFNMDLTLDPSGETVSGLVPDEGYVLTGQRMEYGAAYMFDEELMKKIADSFGTDIVILPSSTHEVILLRKQDEMDIETFQNMVEEVNNTMLQPVELLSYGVYQYEKDTHTFSRIDTDSQTQGMDMTM